MVDLCVMLFLLANSGTAESVPNVNLKTHPGRMSLLISALGTADLQQALEDSSEEEKKRNKILHHMEKGRIYQIQGNFDKSKFEFEEAIALINRTEGRAVMSMKRIGKVAASVAVNDKILPYDSYGYERILIHHYQAINYLALGEMEGAMVEVRRANARQVEELENHYKRIEKAEEKAEKQIAKAEKKRLKEIEKAEAQSKQASDSSSDKGNESKWKQKLKNPFGRKKDATAKKVENTGQTESETSSESTEKSSGGFRGFGKRIFKRNKTTTKTNSTEDKTTENTGDSDSKPEEEAEPINPALINWGNVRQSLRTEMDKEYEKIDSIAGKVKNSFQNAYTFYFSGMLYEQNQKLNDAYIDYRKGLEIYPNHPLLINETIKLAKKLKRNQDLAEFVKTYPNAVNKVDNESGTGLVVFFEEGLVPPKKEIKIVLPIDTMLIPIALPFYENNWDGPNPMTISRGNVAKKTEPLCDIQALTAMALKEQARLRIARQITRMIAKGGFTMLAENKAGALGNFAANAYNVASENADLRSWLTLPRQIQVARMDIKPGSQYITLKQKRLGINEKIEISPKEGQTVLLQVMYINKKVYINPIYI